MSRRSRRNPDSHRNLYLGLGAAAVVLGAAWWWRRRMPAARTLATAPAPAPVAGRDASTTATTLTGELTPLQIAQATLRAVEGQAADTSLSAADRQAATELIPSLRERVRSLSATS